MERKIGTRIFVENFSGFTKDGVKFDDMVHTFFECTNQPMPPIIAGRAIKYFTDDKGEDMAPENKPPYCVPLMSKIAALPWNGFKVVSTFAGAGGSSTGYRMAGFKVALANEFVPIAQDSYRANMDPSTVIDPRGIQEVTAASILEATGLKEGDLDLFDGSPPCQAFSTAGKRAKGWGTDRAYEHGACQKNEDLFPEYIRVLAALKPKVFVAENVSGLVKGVAKGFFLEILAGLKACGYRVEARVLDAQWLGVPQMRQRLIFMGVRNDLGANPVFPKPLTYQYTVRDALPWIVRCEEMAGYNGHQMLDSGRPSQSILLTGSHHCEAHLGTFHGDRSIDDVAPTVQTHGRPKTLNELTIASGPAGIERRKFTIAEVKRICAFPDDFILKGTYAQQWERLGNSVPPVMMAAIAVTIRDKILIPAREKAAPEVPARLA